MAENFQESFQTLLDEELVLIGKFEEHLNFAINVVNDTNVKAFFTHVLEEEQEHREKVQALMEKVQALGTAAPTAGPSPTTTTITPEEQYGHFQRRDQNVLTVGSLYGVKQ